MYDMKQCKDCGEDTENEYDNISRRLSSSQYHMEEYDRMKGKGSFKKNEAGALALMDELMDRKTALLKSHLVHSTAPKKEESKGHSDDAVESPPVI